MSAKVTEIIKLEEEYGVYIAGETAVNFYSYTDASTIVKTITLGGVPFAFLDAGTYLMVSYPLLGKIDAYDLLLNTDFAAPEFSVTGASLGITTGTFTPTNMHFFIL